MKKSLLSFLILSTSLSSCSITNFPNFPIDNSDVEGNESISLSETFSEEEVVSENINTVSEPQVELSEESSSEFLSSEEQASLSEETSEELTSEEPVSPSHNPAREAKNISNYLDSTGDVYRINITSNNSIFPYNNEDYIQGSLNITEQDTSKVILTQKNMGIRLRGNSTLGGQKKPFKIKFEAKQSLFGLSAAKNWVLLANYFDKTNIRNYLAYVMANKMSNLYFQPSSIMVDVYYDGVYQGLYLLCENMEANKGRVDIKKNVSSNGIDSFFLEVDARAVDEYSGQEGKCYLSSGNYKIKLKYPDCDDYLDALNNQYSEDSDIANNAKEFITQYTNDVNWLSNFLSDTKNAITNKMDYDEYIDVDSFIDTYLIQELFKNVDYGSTSEFFYIDSSQESPKLVAGPVWDFDIGGGVIDNTSSYVYAGYAASDLWVRNVDYYYQNLFQDKDFVNKVKERYAFIRDDLLTIFTELDLARRKLVNAQTRNIKKWSLPGPREAWIEVYAMSNNYYNLTTLSAHYKLLEDFLDKRIELLDKTYLH